MYVGLLPNWDKLFAFRMLASPVLGFNLGHPVGLGVHWGTVPYLRLVVKAGSEHTVRTAGLQMTPCPFCVQCIGDRRTNTTALCGAQK